MSSSAQKIPPDGLARAPLSGLGNGGYLTGDCDFSLLKSQMNSKGGDFTAYGKHRMAVNVPHIANARSIDEMRRKL